jgi:hypothetical protein
MRSQGQPKNWPIIVNDGFATQVLCTTFQSACPQNMPMLAAIP